MTKLVLDPSMQFSTSPFGLTASIDSAQHWAARADALKRIRRILHAMANRNEAMLELIWANFGAGKSHVLYFILNQMEIQGIPSVSAYVEMSEGLKTFLDLYKLIASSLNWYGLLAKCDAAVLTSTDQNFRRIATILKFGGSDEQSLAMRWVLAEKVDLRELRRVANVSSRIEDDRSALDALHSIIAICQRTNRKLVLLFDEFQRVAAFGERARANIMSNIRTFFNQNPQNLVMIIAVTSGVEHTAMALLPQELRTILGPRPGLSLPELSAEEALEFCRERLQAFRPANYVGDEWAPFGQGGVRAVVDYIVSQTKVRLTPRNLIHALAWLYEDAIIERKGSYTKGEVKRIMDELAWEALR